MDCAIALTPDASQRNWDISVSGGHLVMDWTPATPMVLGTFSDRRANVDDVLPSGVTDDTGPIFNDRRGWAGDALDTSGLRIGSRLWLYERSKLNADIVAQIQDVVSEGQQAVRDARGIDIDVTVTRLSTNAIEIVVQALDGTDVTLSYATTT